MLKLPFLKFDNHQPQVLFLRRVGQDGGGRRNLVKKSSQLPDKKAILRRFSLLRMGYKKFSLILLLIFLLILTAFGLRLILSSNAITITPDSIHCVSQSDLSLLANAKKINILLDEKNLTQKLKKKYNCIESIDKVWHPPVALELKVSGRKAFLSLKQIQKSTVLPSLSPDEATSSTAAAKPSPQIITAFGDAFLVDGTGFVFASDDGKANLPQVFYQTPELGLNQTVNSEYVIKITEALDGVKKLSLNYETAEWIDDYLLLKSKVEGEKNTNDFTLYFSLDKPVAEQVASLQLILQKAKINSKSTQKVDLRFEKPVVVYTPDKKKS